MKLGEFVRNKLKIRKLKEINEKINTIWNSPKTWFPSSLMYYVFHTILYTVFVMFWNPDEGEVHDKKIQKHTEEAVNKHRKI